MNLGPGAGDPGHPVPPSGNEKFMELSADNANKQQAFCVYIVYYYFHPRWVNRINRLTFGSSFILLTHTRAQIIIHNKTLAASAYCYIIHI